MPLIEPFDYEKFQLESKAHGVKADQAEEHYKEMLQLIKVKTVEHLLPNMPLSRIDGTSLSLRNLIKGKKNILMFSISKCLPCEQAYFQNFPEIKDSLDKKGIKYSLISIVVQKEHHLKKVNSFHEKLTKYESLYGQVYVMKDSLAKSLNVFSYPVQLFINENGVVKHYERGASSKLNSKKLAKVLEFFNS